MAESRWKDPAFSHDGKDRISELPLHIQEIILCLLPIQDAVATSALSRKWRHCWKTIPNLIFDDPFSVLLELDHYFGDHMKAIKFVGVVNKLLLLHSGPILKFSLTCPMSVDAEVVHDFIDRWIPLFSEKGTKQLILDKEAGIFKAHDYSSLDLTHLRLRRSLFPHNPALGGFVNLIKLELVLAGSNFGQTVIDCPALEKLTLIFCSEIFPANFRAPSLKCLHQVRHNYQVSEEYDFLGLENLTEHSYVVIRNQEMEKSSNVVKLLGSLPNIEKFSSGIDFLRYLAVGGCPHKLPQPPPYLKTLNIWEMNFANLSEVSCLLCLIRSAPNLCILHMSHFECFHYPNCACAAEEVLKNYLIEDFEDCTINHLERVTFSRFTGIKTELEVIKFLLGHSPLLKTMCIHFEKFMQKDVALTMKEEIMQYSRDLSGAEIKYLEAPVVVDDFDFELWHP